MKRYARLQPVPPDCAERITALQAKYSLTQMRLADLLGVSFATVSRWESGLVRPAPDLWQRIARAEQDGLAALSSGHGSMTAIHEAPAAYVAAPNQSLVPDFTADAESVRVAVEAHRLEYGYLVNPAFATEVSLIEPLPHQRFAHKGRSAAEHRHS